MAQDIHPKMNKVKFQFSENREMEIPSTYKKSSFLTETDIFIHPAWREDQKIVHASSGNVAKFKKTFGDFSFGASLSEIGNKNN
jgi:ribosomal protein L31